MLAVNGVVRDNVWWVDTYTANPMDIWEWLVPFMRPPDVPNERGIGLPDTPLNSLKGQPVWPPYEEIGMVLPPEGTKAGSNVDISVQLSPLCYPSHDHSEPSQTSQGGNYNLGLIAGMDYSGDRTLPGGVVNFPNPPAFFGVRETGPASGPEE